MAKVTRSIHIIQGSLKVSDPVADFKEDIRYQLSFDPDLVFLTEMRNFHNALREVLPDSYRPIFLPNNKEEAFYVKVGDHANVKSRGAVKVHPGDPGTGADGLVGYPARYVNWVQMNWWGEDIWYHGSHWVPGQTFSSERQSRHVQMSKQVAKQVRLHSRGDAVCFFSGDANINAAGTGKEVRNSMDRIFRDEGLLTIWDEMGVAPSTHGGPQGPTIDIIGSFNLDKRVKATRWKVHPRTNSDHRFVSAWYDITDKVKGGVSGGASNGGGGSGTGGGSNGPGNPQDDENDETIVSGGNRDFSDYLDGSVYALPWAIDDSDVTNG